MEFLRNVRSNFIAGFTAFSPSERRNVTIYIAGIMIYKFGLEAFIGSVTALATNRYDYDARLRGTKPETFFKVGLLTGLNQAFQCVGSIAIAPLIRRYKTKNILSVAILVFGIFSALLLIVDAATGGTFMPEAYRGDGSTHPDDDYSYYGRYNTDGMIPVYCVCGVVYGMVELIRRIIPRDIVGGDVQKLRKMDSLVHIFYETTGTAGAFTTGLVLIPRFGNNMAFLITPICFAFAAVVWYFIRDVDYSGDEVERRPPSSQAGAIAELDANPAAAAAAATTTNSSHNHNLTTTKGPTSNILIRALHAVYTSFVLFFESVLTGGRIIFTRRKFIWLLPGYSLALYGHRFLENTIAPAVAKRYLGESAWSQIMVGGSNLGELLGALSVFLFTNVVTTPIPWLRIDALMLLIVWYLPYWRPLPRDVGQAWVAAATLIPVSYGWAAGDVSLAAYIQASLARVEGSTRNVSALGAVMAFLYCTYIVLVAVMSPVLGSYIDDEFNRTGGEKGGGNIYEAIRNVSGVQFTLLSAIVLAATFVPRGSWALNPDMLYEENLDGDIVRGHGDASGGVVEYREKTRQGGIAISSGMGGGFGSDDDIVRVGHGNNYHVTPEPRGEVQG